MRLVHKLLSAALLTASALISPVAGAAAITGAITFADGITNPDHGATDIVSLLTTFMQGPTTLVTGCTAFAPCNTLGAAFTYSFAGGPGQLIYAIGTYTFYVDTFTVTQSQPPFTCDVNHQCQDHLSFNGTGYVHDSSGTYSDTIVGYGFSLTGGCTDTTFDNQCDTNWTASYDTTATANGVLLQVPEPGTLALIGLGLAGLGVARRRKS